MIYHGPDDEDNINDDDNNDDDDTTAITTINNDDSDDDDNCINDSTCNRSDIGCIAIVVQITNKRTSCRDSFNILSE